MASKFKTVDLFAGPGGLAEGFSSLLGDDGFPVFDIALSVEKEDSAFSTLRLRSFYRQFLGAPPVDYHLYLEGQITKAELAERFPEQWAAAEKETLKLELGTPEAKREIDQRLDELRENSGCEIILIGGPPCQAYSLVGRARNQGKVGYKAENDHRHFLYQEYIRIVERLRPAAFVMENVKGILSSKIGGQPIFNQVLTDMRNVGGEADSYMLVPIVSDAKTKTNEFVIRSEDYGIPQKRHRVIVVGVRSDLAMSFSEEHQANFSLHQSETPANVANVLSGMPILRSGLSKSSDSEDNWRTTVIRAFKSAEIACLSQGGRLKSVGLSLAQQSRLIRSSTAVKTRKSNDYAFATDPELGKWLSRGGPRSLPNHETRGHMESDLARYAFAATFAGVYNRSPKAMEFPAALAPKHANWKSGKFADRFRVQQWNEPSSTITSHISKDGHYFIHPDPLQCRSLTVREAARLQTFPDDYLFEGNRTQQYVQVGNAVPPLLARQIAKILLALLSR